MHKLFRYLFFITLPFIHGIILGQEKVLTLVPKEAKEIEFGIHSGILSISGDVDHSLIPGYAIGIHIRKEVNPVLSFRGDLSYGKSYGLNAQPSGTDLIDAMDIFAGYNENNPWFFAYQATLLRINIQTLLDLTNWGEQKLLKKYNLYVFGGIGLNSHGTKLNLKDASNNLYTDLLTKTAYGTNDYNTIKGRRAIRNSLKEIYDKSYETDAPKEFGRFRLGDETNITPEISIGFGISRQLSKKINIGLEHQLVFSDNNYIDGKVWRSDVDQTQGTDLIQYSNVRLTLNLGTKSTNPKLYWLDPLDSINQLLDTMKLQIEELDEKLSDPDSDGVINAVDIQPSSTLNSSVDKRGRTIQSNNFEDGISGIRRETSNQDSTLLAKQLQIALSQLELIRIHNERLNSELDNLKNILVISNNNQLNYPVPAVYFENNSADLNMEAWQTVDYISRIIRSLNVNCITITGYTDEHGTEAYNSNLGLSRAQSVRKALQSEFKNLNLQIIIASSGEIQPEISHPTIEFHHAINRKTIISFCK